MENKSFTQNSNLGFGNTNSQNIPVKPDNYLPLSIIATIVGLCGPCCIGLIVGVIAIIYSTQVDTKYEFRDYLGAALSSKNAKILSFIAIGLGIIGLIFNIALYSKDNGVALLRFYEEILGSLAQ